MAITRSATRSASKDAAADHYKSQADHRSSKASNTTDNRLNNATSSRAVTAVSPGPRTKERCTKQQTVKLEELYTLTGGQPTTQQMEQIAQDIHK